ncbi:cytochrome P450 [Indiicoccus explosivorum]|uniref:cytochrome P450 n=1 Tax=Indiicoccus explosivorum TaxID=1917864 RepID=UPI000B43AFE7|nr:cytochrome P450 [Indiicoccus explosivorum]
MTRVIPETEMSGSTTDILREGYRYIPDHMEELGTDIYRTRILGQKSIVMTGPEAVELFYNERYFERSTAIPPRVRSTLFGTGGVQVLDDRQHRHRKAMFMSLMTMPRLQLIAEIAAEQWENAARKWEKEKTVVLFDEAQKVMLRTACRWAGVPLQEKDTAKRAKQLTELVDALGGVGPRYWKGVLARHSVDEWMAEVIKQERSGKLRAPEGSPLRVISRHQELDGSPLSTHTAAVELVNIIRPITAISWYVMFGAMAMLANPETRGRLATGEETYAHMFTQEVRRFYPFGPFLGARVRRNFRWKDMRFRKGELVFLDIFGMNRDGRLWEEPDRFIPERFRNWTGTPFDFIPQGGGDHYLGHRCAGEWVTIEVMRESMQFLAGKIDYRIPSQNLHMDLGRIPIMPESRFIMTDVRLKR